MPTHKTLTDFFVVNESKFLARPLLSALIGKRTYDLLGQIQPSQERAAKRIWSSVKRFPTGSPLALSHFWRLINLGAVDLRRPKDLDTFCRLLNTYPDFRRVIVKLVFEDEDATDIENRASKRLSIRVPDTFDVVTTVSSNRRESESQAVQKIKEWLKDPVVMTGFVDQCACWLVNLDADTLAKLLEENHAAVRFLNPDSFGIEYAHGPTVLQKRFNSVESIKALLVRDVSDAPADLVKVTEQYYFATVLKFALERQPALLKQILESVIVDYPQALSDDLQIIRKRLLGDGPNLYLANFLSTADPTKKIGSDHHHHYHHHHSHDEGVTYGESDRFVLFEILCGQRQSNKIAGQKFTERLTKALEIGGDPLVFLIELINLKKPNKNVIDFFFKNATTVLPIVARTLSKNAAIALRDVMTRRYLFDGNNTTMANVYAQKFSELLSLLKDEALSTKQRADVYAEIRANLENDFLRQFLSLETADVESLLNHPEHGRHFAPIVVKYISEMNVSREVKAPEQDAYLEAEKNIVGADSFKEYFDSLDGKEVADIYLLSTTHWGKVNPRTSTRTHRILSWLNKVFPGAAESYFSKKEEELATAHSIFRAKIEYEKTEKEKSFEAFLVEYAKANWIDDIKDDEGLATLVCSFLNGSDIFEFMRLTGSYALDEDNAFKRVVMASSFLKTRLLDAIAIDNQEHSLEILYLLMQDEALIRGYLEDNEFRLLVAKILQQVENKSYDFMCRIEVLDSRLFVEMADYDFEGFIKWFGENSNQDTMNLVLRSGHKDFSVRVLRRIDGADASFIKWLVEQSSEEFNRACTEQPSLVRYVLDQSADVRAQFYLKSFYLIGAMYARGGGKVGYDLSEEVVEEITNRVFEFGWGFVGLVSNAGADPNQITLVRNILDTLFQHGPKEFFRDFQEDELWVLYNNLTHPEALFEKEFVQSHKPAIVQMFCQHILDISIDYWPVIFDDPEALETVLISLESEDCKAVVDRVCSLPSRDMYQQLSQIRSPIIKQFLDSNPSEEAYALLRNNYTRLMGDVPGQTVEKQEENLRGGNNV